jgi:transcriptional regulator with XRE-family HTH domain
MINRIQSILKSKNLSPSVFADAIGVQRSGVSHILSERNKPSLDFVIKILKAFPEIDADWLLFGKGEMTQTTSESKTKLTVKLPALKINETPEIGKHEEKTITSSHPPALKDFHNKGEIAKIVILYTDNTFSEYIAR